MSKRPAVVLLALLLCSLAGPMVVSAEQSGSIEASASTVTLQPSTPLRVTIWPSRSPS